MDPLAYGILQEQGVAAWNRWLSAQPSSQIDLSDCVFVGAQLSGASFRGVDVSLSDFANANLNGCDFSDATAPSARFADSNLKGATFLEADVRQADFSRADLTDADMRGCIGHDAVFSDSRLDRAVCLGSELVRANFARASMIDADLRNSQLGLCEFPDAKLDDTDFSGSNLREANFRGVMCSRGAFFGSDLKEADLRDSTLRNCDLRRADLRGARLQNSVIITAAMAAADLTDSIWGTTVLAQTDLRSATGIEHARHEAPSSISVDVLYQSRGQVPIAFLEGAGMSGLFAAYALDTIHAESTNSIRYYSAFLSHSSADKPIVGQVHDYLSSQGIPCWLDRQQIFPGDDIEESIDLAIESADRVILFCSETSLSTEAGWWVDREVTRALAKEARLAKMGATGSAARVLIPVALDGHLFSESCRHKRREDLRSRLAARLDEGGDRRTEMERLVAAMSTTGPLRPHSDRFRSP